MSRDLAIVAATIGVIFLGAWWALRRARNALLTSAALLAFALLPLGAAAQAEKKFAHLEVEEWDANACEIITWSEYNHGHLFFRCALAEEQRKFVIAPRALHTPIQVFASEKGQPGEMVFIQVAWKEGDGPVRPATVRFYLWRTQLYLAIEPQGRCPAGNFHNSSEPKSQT